MLELPPLSLYIHFPWCAKKCPYCDFNSHAVTGAIPEQAYIEALSRDLADELPWVQNRKIGSIFIGGGTPSLFSVGSIRQLLDNCSAQLDFSADIEITMEANPGSSDHNKFAALREAGINRLSIGVQSFDDQLLQGIGRIHTGAEAEAAIRAARRAGFERINIDLMHGLPGQTPIQALADLRRATDMEIQHISWYQLTLEQNTEFHRYPPSLPDEDVVAEMHEQGVFLLQKQGFRQYEISAFCQQGQQARHNLNYWQFGDYIAIGAGAHGKVTLPGKNQVIRYSKTRSPRDYLSRASSFIADSAIIEGEELVFEALMNCLRLEGGMWRVDFLRYTGASDKHLEKLCQPLVAQGWLELSPVVRSTAVGRRYLNNLLELLVQDWQETNE